MLTINSFLQRVFQMVKSLTTKVTKRMYRQAAVFITGVAVMTVIMLTSNQFGGGGKNALTAFADTNILSQDEDSEQPEEEEQQSVLLSSVEQGQKTVSDQLEKILRGREQKAKQVQQSVGKMKDSIFSELETDSAVVSVGQQSDYGISAEDYQVLLKIVQAEAGICDDKGKVLVANVIMNRVASSEFPDTITEVVYQQYQFSPVLDGTINTVEITSQTIDCVKRALEGEDYSQGALYFMYRKGSESHAIKWFDRKLTFLFQHERHEFFK